MVRAKLPATQGTSSENLVEIYKFSLGKMAINPALLRDAAQYDESLRTIGDALPSKNKKADQAWHNIDGLQTSIAQKCERVGNYSACLWARN